MANISTKASRITHQIDDEAKTATHEKIRDVSISDTRFEDAEEFPAPERLPLRASRVRLKTRAPHILPWRSLAPETAHVPAASSSDDFAHNNYTDFRVTNREKSRFSHHRNSRSSIIRRLPFQDTTAPGRTQWPETI